MFYEANNLMIVSRINFNKVETSQYYGIPPISDQKILGYFKKSVL